jgi:imidazolonepropionase-like amidohydrolase
LADGSTTLVADRELADLVVVAQLLYDGMGNPPVQAPALLIQGERIIGVEVRSGSWRPPGAAEVVSELEGTIVPGLIDAHVHLCGIRPEQGVAGTAVKAVSQAQRALASGVTTVRDCGGPGNTTIAVKQALQAGVAIGPRIVACGPPLTTSAGHCHWLGGRADSATELKRRIRQLREQDADFIKIMLTGGMSTPGSNPSRPQYSLQEMAAAVEDAHRIGMRVAAHTLSSAGADIAVGAGVDTIEHGWTITGRPQGFQLEDAERVAAADYPVILSVTAHRDLRHLVTDPDRRQGVPELRRRLEPHRALRGLGVPVMVSSDADGDHTPLDRFDQSIEAYRIGMETTFEAALHAASGLPAQALGLADSIGALIRGRVADVVVLGADPAHDVAAMTKVRRVLLGGREVASDGDLRTTGEPAAKSL